VTFRFRLTIALIGLAVVPLVGLGLGIRFEMTNRLEEQANARAAALVAIVRQDLETERRSTKSRLRALGSDLAADSRFRLALAGEPAGRRWLLDWATPAMRIAGFDFLEVLDGAERILSSGHFRNEFDRPEPGLLDLIRSTDAGVALVAARLADGSAQVLVAADSFQTAGRRFAIIGGRTLDSVRIAGFARGDEIRVRLVLGDSVPLAAAIEMPYLDAAGGAAPARASIEVATNPDLARALVGRLERWLGLALGASLALALIAAWWLGRLVARPVIELADRAAGVDLERLDLDFATDRSDEIGTLARRLDQMTGRLRLGAARQREAERRAATGDLARQVNHDIKNGLAPLRHVLRHLGQTAEREPAALAPLYLDRRSTLESSIEYLDQLARNYAKLSPSLATEPCDANAILDQVARTTPAGSVTIATRPALDLPKARADAVVLRRILENLVTNAVDAFAGSPGRVLLTSGVGGESPTRMIRLVVADTGPGIPPDQLGLVFDDFFTTKPSGTGLGLSVVRRLVADLGGTVRVESAVGRGATFTVEIPAA